MLDTSMLCLLHELSLSVTVGLGLALCIRSRRTIRARLDALLSQIFHFNATFDLRGLR